MAEDYWMALTRDMPYSQYGIEPLTQAAIVDLNAFPNYAGVNAGSLFRGVTTGDLTGPFVSQFLLQNVPYGATTIVQQYRVPLPILAVEPSLIPGQEVVARPLERSRRPRLRMTPRLATSVAAAIWVSGCIRIFRTTGP